MRTDTPRRRLPSRERRPLIVQAALEEFAARGYEGASMRCIGEASGVARTVLYDYFPSKRALFVALLEDKTADLMGHLREAYAADADWEERIRATLEAFFAYAEREPLAWRLLFPDRSPVDPGAAADHRRVRADANRLLAELLAPDARRAGLDPTSPEGQAMFALQQAALHGLVRWWHAHPAVGRERLVRVAMDGLWTGLGGLERGSA